VTFVLGVLLIVAGVICIVVGLVLGTLKFVQDELRQPQLQSAKDLSFFTLLKALLEAPRDKMFFVGGFLLVALGVALAGVA